MKNDDPDYLYKVLSDENWAKSKGQGWLVLDSFDDEFIHLAKEDQVPHVLNKFWHGRKDYVVLRLDVKKIEGNLVYETNPGGTTKYYHLYEGRIPLEAVIVI